MMPLWYLSKVCQGLLAVVGLFVVAKGSVIEEFFRWIFLGSVLDFVYSSYSILASFLIVGVMVRWIRDWRWLAFIGVLVFLFLTFAF